VSGRATADVHQRYARWLEIGARISLVVMAVGFALYMTGAMAPLIEPERLATLWGLPADQYLAATDAPTGWSWLVQLGHGDVIGELGVALLALCSLPCLLALLPLYHAAGDRLYLWLCIGQCAVLVFSASGLLVVG
jgi:hypothetical protein